MSPQTNKVIAYISLVVATVLVLFGLMIVASMPPTAGFWQGYYAVANYLDKLGYIVVAPVVVFFLIGLWLFVGEVKPNAEGIVEDKAVLWLRWSLFVSAFLVSGVFREVAILAAVFGWFVKSEKNWKYALAISCLVTVLFKS